MYKVIFAFFGALGDIGLESVGITGFERGTIGDIQGTRLGATVKLALFCLIKGVFKNQALPFLKSGVTFFENQALPFLKSGVTFFENQALLGNCGFNLRGKRFIYC